MGGGTGAEEGGRGPREAERAREVGEVDGERCGGVGVMGRWEGDEERDGDGAGWGQRDTEVGELERHREEEEKRQIGEREEARETERWKNSGDRERETGEGMGEQEETDVEKRWGWWAWTTEIGKETE